jgi:large subunit ribosomal protein L34e
MPDSRWTREGMRHAYNTKSSRLRGVRTPGGKLVKQRVAKKTKGPVCSVPGCRTVLPGLPHLKKSEYSRSKQRQRTVSRCYGGSTCHACVKSRIIRAFLLEEQKAVKKVLAERK